MVPGAGAVSEARVSRSFFTGRCSARRLRAGNAASRLTETTWSISTSAGKSRTAAAALSQAITIRAWWSSNWWRSSPRGVQRVVFDDDGAQAQHRVERDDVLRAVGQDQGHPVAGADTEPAQPLGRPVHLVAEFVVTGAPAEELHRGCARRPRPRTAPACPRATPWAVRSPPGRPAGSSSPRAARQYSPWPHHFLKFLPGRIRVRFPAVTDGGCRAAAKGQTPSIAP